MKAVRIGGAVLVGAVMLVVLVIVPAYMGHLVQRIAPQFPASSIVSYFFNVYTLSLGAVLAIVTATAVVINEGALGGSLKALQGIVGMLYFLYLLHFGSLSITVSALGMPVTIELAVSLGLIMIELALAIRVIEGIAVARRS
ncbi:MAG: hypothetical protein ACP5NC_08050 [Nitrososphaeria archaeon]